ncbi:MAG: WecB/TagA/CpsF family glycosyltransferase [Clostridia bacterium]|nr:WecB/TagA/CpsF family glycosyltransferase [Clostridia bacterium]
MRTTVNILGVRVDKITAEDAVTRAEELLRTDGVSAIYTPNPEIVMAAYNNPEFLEILNKADLCTADGIGVVYASRMLKDPVPERVAGFDLTCSLLSRIAKTGEGVFLFGAKPGVAERAKENLEKTYPGLVVSGFRNGYFTPEDDDSIVEQINQSGAKLLLVCLGAPKQEQWIDAHRDRLHVNLCMGVGGSLDVFAGEAKRAPKIFIQCNLEWLYRLLKQPKRIGRYAALPKFILTVKKEG